MTISELALWQEVLLVGLAAISLLYVFYFRIWVALATGADLLFTFALVAAVASVLLPGAFGAVSTRVVDHSPLPGALTAADERVAMLEALPRTLLARALSRLGYEPEEAGIEPPPPEGSAAAEPGPFATRVRPAFEALLTGVMRVLSFLVACALLLMALSLRSATSSTRAVHDLVRRIDRLEARLEGAPEDLPA